ncbi:MAG: hypothetical protein JRJ19_04000 [Deltaproteobacteria bacterium]|nr:hypothetical protein [Deltaproteobacteria bacterium]MBW1871201.1 hypothetical protein [Deltaproteobacteria bacterium]
MRALLVVGCLCVLLVAGLIAFMLLGDDSETNFKPPTPATVVKKPKPAQPVRRYPQQTVNPRNMTDEARENRIVAMNEEIDGKAVMQFGKEFHDKWYKDREQLGVERHKEMEKLWFAGRRPRGKAESIEQLEKLIEEFPDTNRAGCAAFELGHHYMRDRTLDLKQRRAKAEHYWHLTEDRYRDSLCEYNAQPAAMSKLAMATWVYRSTDPGKAKRLLEEVIEKHKGQTDHLGQPLEVTAKRMLELIK